MGSEGGFRGRQGRSADLSSSADSGRPQDLASLAAYSAPLWERGIPALRSQRQSPDPVCSRAGSGSAAPALRGEQGGTLGPERAERSGGPAGSSPRHPLSRPPSPRPPSRPPSPCLRSCYSSPRRPSRPASPRPPSRPASPRRPSRHSSPSPPSHALPQRRTEPLPRRRRSWDLRRLCTAGLVFPWRLPPWTHRRPPVERSPSGNHLRSPSSPITGLRGFPPVLGTRSQPGAQEDGLPGRRQTGQVVAVPAATFRRMCQTRRAFGLLAVVVEATHSALLGSESSRKMQHSHLRTSSDALADLVVVMGQALPVPGPGNGLDPAVAAAMKAMSESIALASAVDLAGSCASMLRVSGRLGGWRAARQ
ncbi:hypothetical protein CLOP_g5015 [Closterium sp. NIES-67]|nr:hypothetical protein CLOP_g5015 [Closterium sp. NIES-67]